MEESVKKRILPKNPGGKKAQIVQTKKEIQYDKVGVWKKRNTWKKIKGERD